MTHSEKIAEDFSNIYKHEYKAARADLGQERHEEEVIYLLMRIVRGIYDMYTEDGQGEHNHKHSSTDKLTKDFIHHNLPTSLHHDQVTAHVRTFIHACIVSVKAMCSHNKPLDIFWIPKGEPIDSSMFDTEAGREGQICDWTVWPAVVRADGSVVRKGIVIPI